MTSGPHNWPGYAIAIGLILFGIGVVFGSSAHDGFLRYDDDLNIVQNHRLLSSGAPGNFWTAPYENLYIPVTYTVWAALAKTAEIEKPAAGQPRFDASCFHFANLVVHALTAIGVLELLVSLGARTRSAAVGALFFALHPLVVEPVAWVTGMKDLLCGCLGVWSLVIYVRGMKGSGGSRAVMYAVASVLFVGAMLAKPQTAVLPVVAFVMDYLLLRRNARRAVLWLAPWLIAAIPVVMVARAAQPVTAGEAPTVLWQRPIVVADALAFYMRKAIWPVDLSVDYGRTSQWLMSSAIRYVPSLVVAIAVVGCAVLLRRRAAWFTAGVCVFIAALLPVLGLNRFEFQRISNVADRYAYTALIGVATLVAMGLDRIHRRIGWVMGIAALGLLALAIDSRHQVEFWIGEESLFSHAMEVTPNSKLAPTHLALIRQDQHRNDEAEALFQLAIERDPTGPARINLANLYRQEGRNSEAENLFRQSLVYDRTGTAYFDLGNLDYGQGRLPEAIVNYRAALPLMKGRAAEADVHTNLGLALLKMREVESATAQLRESLTLNPNNPRVWTALGQTLLSRGDLSGATGALEHAIEVDPQFVPARQMLDAIRAHSAK